MVSPRRSGRTTSTPADRNSRWQNKLSPRQKSPSPASLSEDDNMDPLSGPPHSPPDESRQTRRATRAQHTHTHTDDADQQDQPQETDGDDEVTRCVCGLQDYPGPPLTDDFPTITDASQAEDAGGLFIQCDKCHVWQHGGCVGIMDEGKSPENYFCELCEKKLHSVLTDTKGQRYSIYLPVLRPESKQGRKTSLSKESDSAVKARRERDSMNRASVESSTGKRRSTMNSRQAYDDEEILRKVIEETKESNGSTRTVRKGKRGRDDSEDFRHETKRQRTGSESPEPPSTLHTASLGAESDDDGTQPKSIKKARSAAAEVIRQRETRERERTRDAKRAEAAGRRSARAGRRRVDGVSEGPDQIELAIDADSALDERSDVTPVPRTSQPPPSPPLPPPASAPTQAPGSSHKKGSLKKQKRLGRNQYSAQPSPAHLNASSGDDPTTTDDKASPSSANDTPTLIVSTTLPLPKPTPANKWGSGRAKNPRQAAIIQDSELMPNTTNKDRKENNNNTNTNSTNSSINGINNHVNQMSITDMKKRTAMMMDYIAKAQGHLAPPPENNNLLSSSSSTTSTCTEFNELSSKDMMQVLSKHITTWQNEYSGEAVAGPATTTSSSSSSSTVNANAGTTTAMVV